MSILTQELMADDAINTALASPFPRWENGQLIWVYPPGKAQGCFDLSNRGLALLVEITYWPKPKRHLLTAGRDNRLESLKLKGEQLRMVAILQLPLDKVSLWVEAWRTRGRMLAAHRAREIHRLEKLTITMKARA